VSSKAGSRIKRASDVIPARRRGLPLLAAGAALLLCAASEPVATMPDGRPTPSRQPVPRWLSLKSDEVRARFGPGLDHRILWEYRVAGLPVQVIAETREWRKICDPQGAVAWVHRSVVSSRRTVFNPSHQELPLHAGRNAASAVRARLAPQAVISLDQCRDGWCDLGGRKVHGWAPESALIGVQQQAMCDAARPAGPARSR